MKITDIKTTIVSIPFSKPLAVSTFNLESRDVVIVEVTTDQGVTGIGYMMTLGRGIRTLKSVIDNELKDLVIGEDPFYRQKIWEKLWWQLNFFGRKGAAVYAISAIDVALWDIMGKITNLPIHSLLGPSKDKLEAYGGGGWLSLSIDEILDEVENYKKLGLKAYKMRVGLQDWRKDVERVKAVRDAFGYDLEIMIDANQGLDVASSIILGRELEKLGVYWFEEPVHADDIAGLAQIAETLDMRVATGETEYGRYGFKDIIDRKAADIIQIDIQRVGGITEWIRVANMADAWGLKVTPHLFWEISNQLTCAVPNAVYIEYMDWLDEFFEELPLIKDGFVYTWNKPGHGLVFREDIIKKYKVN
ncbi:mandelate racemase/muconate lactonizing enzyme family protein [bacterium LRH843]|nr:mandelate racemase/muconate lactonizing enzyme family protein [bacterium LRH843]